MSNWIDAKEELPSDDKYKLVITIYDDYDLAWYCKEYKEWRWNAFDSIKVKYWMELPKKP